MGLYDDFWTQEEAGAVVADAVEPFKYTESGTRRVSKMLRDPSGRWMKRRTKTPVQVPTWEQQRGRKAPVPVYDLTRNPLSGLPADVYERLDDLVGDHGKPPGWVQDTIGVIRRVRGKPGEPVVVYTAAPRGVKRIDPKDWVSLAPGFARVRAEAYPGWRVLKATVPASEVFTRSDDLLRWTWEGKDPVVDGGTTVPRVVRGRYGPPIVLGEPSSTVAPAAEPPSVLPLDSSEPTAQP